MAKPKRAPMAVEGRFAGNNKTTMSHHSKSPTHDAANRRTALRFCSILLLLAGIALARPMMAEKGKPLSSKDVSDLLDGSVPSSEIARVVTENGISFHMDDDLEHQFRRDGATGELIDALKRADKTEAPPPAPPTASPSSTPRSTLCRATAPRRSTASRQRGSRSSRRSTTRGLGRLLRRRTIRRSLRPCWGIM